MLLIIEEKNFSWRENDDVTSIASSSSQLLLPFDTHEHRCPLLIRMLNFRKQPYECVRCACVYAVLCAPVCACIGVLYAYAQRCVCVRRCICLYL